MSEKMKADLHIHTKASRDWLHETFGVKQHYTWREAIERAAEIGLGALALTEHGIFHDYKETQTFANRSEVILIPAVELRGVVSEGGVSQIVRRLFGRTRSTIDIIALGVVRPIPEAELELPQLIESIHEQDGLAVLAHPAFPWTALINWFNDEGKALIRQLGIDAIEAFNAGCLPGMNRKAQELAEELDLPVTGGSDTRNRGNIGKAVTVFDSSVTVKTWEDCLKAIRKHKTTVIGESRKLGPWIAQ